MSAYLFENPWPIAMVLLLAAGVALVWYRVTRRNRDAALAFVLLALCVAPFVLDVAVETPAEQINSLLDRLAAATLAGDAETLVEAIAKDYEAGGRNRKWMAEVIRVEFEHTQFSAVSLNGREIEADPNKGSARFVAVVAANYRGHPVNRYPLRMTLSLVREGDEWRIQRIQRFEVLGDVNQEIPLQQR